jgi:hypothetical protein
MKHPKREEWVPFLFGETTPGAQHELSEHLRGCADCRQEIETWQRSLGRLDAWKLPPVRRTAPALAPAFTWAAAAALVLLLGFSIGRLSAKADAQKIRAAITPQIKQELTEELTRLVRAETSRSAAATLAASGQQTEQAMTFLARDIDARRTADNREIFAAMSTLGSQSLAEFVSLKKDLDTVAVNTDAGLRNTVQEIAQWVDNRPPSVVK